MKAPTKREPWHPAEWDTPEALAIKSLATGTANDIQQKLALRWIIEKVAMTYDQSFVPDDPNGRVAAFIEGRRSVGNQIVKLMRVDLNALEKKNG